MRAVVVGSGGREHELALALGRTVDVVVTPGNPGIPGRTPEGHSLTCSAAPATELDADLFVIGPEAPLVDGLADRLRARGSLVLGPGAAGAALEGSKRFMKELAAAARVPTARFSSFSDEREACAFLETLPGPYVVKTDGLAAGKGVLVTHDLEEAKADVSAKLSGAAFGDAGRTVVIEEGLVGPELSLLVLTDGTNAAALPPAQDFKRLADGDLGPNTGGMGAYSPVPVAGADVVEQVMVEMVEPTLAALRARSIDYRGVLYVGCMLTAEGPKLIEYNVRFGDPETEVIVPRIEGDLFELLTEAASGTLKSEVEIARNSSVCVVIAAHGYPAAPVSGEVIHGIDAADTVPGVKVLHAGTARNGDGQLCVAGGRVLVVRGVGDTLEDARDRTYRGVEEISFPGMQLRRDIARAAISAHPTRGAGR